MPDGTWRLFRDEPDSGFDPRVRPFYLRAQQAERIAWTQPYVFYEGVAGITCVNPLYDPDGRMQGVLTVDYNLDTLSRFLRQLAVSPNSRLYILSADGTVLAYPEHQVELHRRGPTARGQGELLQVQTLGDPVLNAFDAQLRPQDRIPADAEHDQARSFEFRHNGTAYYARSTAFTIDGDLAWIVAVMAPQSDFLAPAQRASKLSAAASLGAMLLAVAVALGLARRVSGPILSLVGFMDSVREGHLDQRPHLGGAPEFRKLSEALDRMLQDLRDRLRLRSAMAVAMQVQQELLPARAPQVPGLDIHGFSNYCDETGGDYFDYFTFQRQGSASPGLLIVIGDVVGHGIGSAIVMAQARGVLRSRAAGCGHLGELLAHLNDQVVPETGLSRFITMLVWYIDPSTREVCSANAGHDPAIIYDPGSDRFIENVRGGIPLGIERGQDYEETASAALEPGQVVILGTDGIWETIGPNGDYYGKKRLMDVVRAHAGSTARQITDAVQRDLDSFRGDQHQRDDVTLVIVKVAYNST
jgi:phosphoserine phosphatase RsbU/P